jgi:hypothetical protein
MTPGNFSEIGKALFGPNWQKPLADSLGVAERNVRRWAKGEYPVPTGLGPDLIRIFQSRIKRMNFFVSDLQRQDKAQ